MFLDINQIHEAPPLKQCTGPLVYHPPHVDTCANTTRFVKQQHIKHQKEGLAQRSPQGGMLSLCKPQLPVRNRCTVGINMSNPINNCSMHSWAVRKSLCMIRMARCLRAPQLNNSGRSLDITRPCTCVSVEYGCRTHLHLLKGCQCSNCVLCSFSKYGLLVLMYCSSRVGYMGGATLFIILLIADVYILNQTGKRQVFDVKVVYVREHIGELIYIYIYNPHLQLINPSH